MRLVKDAKHGQSVIWVDKDGFSVISPISTALGGKPLVPCMGGWCNVRSRCAHYHQPRWRYPAERLCGAVPEPVPVKESADAA